MAEHGETQADEEEEEQVWSWGAGTDGQLGTTKLQDELLPQLLSLTSLPSISMLACGGAHVIALTSGGKVFTWGRGSSGQLGHGDILNITLPKLVSFFDDSVITQAAAGWSHSGFVSDSGCIFTCGNGSFGQLGHGDTLSLSTPAKVSHFNNDSVKMVACGMRHSLVLFAGNQVCGFGSGKRGQLGFSSDRIKSVNLPCVVSGLKDVEVVRISANGDHSAAISGKPLTLVFRFIDQSNYVYLMLTCPPSDLSDQLMDSSSVGEEDSAAALMFMPLRACLHLYLSEKLL
jgi:alpha-tubulin suppressor-like RCC1 family protein